MKNKYALVFSLLAILNVSTLWAQFGPDVKTYPNLSHKEGRVSMDVAFNGWVYEAFASDSAVVLVMSKDNGNTWKLIDTLSYPGETYNARIVVAGNNANYLRLFVFVDHYIVGSASSDVYVDTYDANTGGFLTIQDIDSYPGLTRGFDIATDTKSPSVSSSPYAIGLLYAKPANYDSLFLVVSTDSGATYGVKQLAASTPLYFRQVSLAYGQSGSFIDGRFFLAWEQFTAPGDTLGNLYTAYTPTFITDAPSSVQDLDSIYTTTAYQLRNPRIATSFSSTTGNDSGNVTALIVVERFTPGISTGSNILGFANWSAVYGSSWTGFDINNTLDNTVQPDVSFDPTISNFLVTYYNATTHQLPYLVNSFNLLTPNIWSYITQNYVDDSAKLVTPWPTVRINPVYTKAALGWTNTYANVPQAMFDAEYRVPVPVVISLTPDTVFVGSTTFTLAVAGEKFQHNSYLMWGADSLGTTYVSGNLLTATIASSLVAAVSTVPVTVVTPVTTGGGGTSNSSNFRIISVSGINEPGGLNTLSIYPNPSGSQLNIAYAFTQTGKLEMGLYDLNGRLVKDFGGFNYFNGNGMITEDVSNIAQGIYQLVIKTGTETAVRKISIAR
jgi:hypothetical protein